MLSFAFVYQTLILILAILVSSTVHCVFVCVHVCSLNGPMWLPSELSVICSEHFPELKSVDDPSFLPRLFPSEGVGNTHAESQVSGRQVADKNVSCDFSVLQKVVDRLPGFSAVVPSNSGGVCHSRADTSQLQETFRQLASQICRMLVAHDSELLIEGTVGVTVDGGARVMLLHFADQVRKNEPATMEENAQNPVSEHTTESNVLRDMIKNGANDSNKVQTAMCSPEEATPDVGNVDYDIKLSPFAANSSPCSTGLSKVLSDLAQQSTNATLASSDVESNPVGLSTHKRKAVADSNSVCEKPKPQTLLRELLCAPLPPKRLCARVNTAAAATTPNIVGEVVQPRRPTANSTVLGGLSRTGNYQHEPNFSSLGNNIYGRDVRPMHQPGAVSQGGYSGPPLGVDVHGPQFGGNAVRALLRLASEHAATGQHDLMRGDQRRESFASQNDGVASDRLIDASFDRRFSRVLYQNLVGSDHGSASSQNSTRSDSSNTVGSVSELAALNVKQEELVALNVKQEVLDPDSE